MNEYPFKKRERKNYSFFCPEKERKNFTAFVANFSCYKMQLKFNFISCDWKETYKTAIRHAS